MGSEANILPVRIYNKMFPDRILADGTPNPEYLQSTTLEFQCNKSSVIQSLGCINLNIGLPGKTLITSQFFLSEHHDQGLLGHHSHDRLEAYTLHMKNFASPFDQSELIPQVCQVAHTTPTGQFQDVKDLM